MLNNNGAAISFNITKTILLLSNEFKKYSADFLKQKGILLSLKTKYKAKINEYDTILQLIIQEESKIEVLNFKISKKRQKMQIRLHRLTSHDYFLHFKDQSYNNECSYQMNLSFTFCCIHSQSEEQNEYNYSSYLTFITKECDFKDLLEYAEKYQKKLSYEYPKIFLFIKNLIINEKVNKYPFDILFEYFKHIYNVISYENDIKILLKHQEDIIDQKNSIFIAIKALEREIIAYDNLLKKNEKYINELSSLLKNYKDYNSNTKDSKEYKGTNNNSNEQFFPKEFIQLLKDFHPLTERQNASNKIYMTTLSINSDINTNQKESNGDSHIMMKKSSSKKKISQLNPMLSNNNSFSTTNKKFFCSFTEILPDQPDQSKIILPIKDYNHIKPQKLFRTIDSDLNEHDENYNENDNKNDFEALTIRTSKYELIESVESICDELPTSPTQIFSIRTTIITSNNPKRSLKESQENFQIKSIL